MEALLALFQTALWVGLAAGIVWRFNKPLHALLSALADRIASGSDVKAGPFEITQQLRPQPPAAQAKKVEAEMRDEQCLDLRPAVETRSVAREPIPGPSLLSSRHFEAEDLALRAVQSEFGVPIKRQLTGGRDMGFDGVFIKENILHIVEVKLTSGRYPRPVIAKAASQISRAAERYHWKSVKIIIVLVVFDEERVREAKEQLLDFSPRSNYQVETRCYSFSELRDMFTLGASRG